MAKNKSVISIYIWAKVKWIKNFEQFDNVHIQFTNYYSTYNIIELKNIGNNFEIETLYKYLKNIDWEFFFKCIAFSWLASLGASPLVII